MRSIFANPYVLLTLAPLLWGGNAVAGKAASLAWQPFTLTSVRWLLVALILLPIAWPHLKKDWQVLRKSWRILFMLGALGMSLFNIMMFTALNYTTAINVSIEQASLPVFIMLANFVLIGQRVRWLQIVGLTISIVGVLVTTTRGEPMQFMSNSLNRGDVIMLSGCVFYAGYTFGLRWRPAVHWLSFMWAIAISAFIMTIPFACWELLNNNVQWPDIRGLVVLGYMVIFPGIISQIAYARGVELIGGNRAGLFINLVPVFGSLLAVLILREEFHVYHAVGMSLVIGGILLAERHNRVPVQTE